MQLRKKVAAVYIAIQEGRGSKRGKETQERSIGGNKQVLWALQVKIDDHPIRQPTSQPTMPAHFSSVTTPDIEHSPSCDREENEHLREKRWKAADRRLKQHQVATAGKG